MPIRPGLREIDLGSLASPDNADPKFDSLADEVRPAADFGLDANRFVGGPATRR